MCSSGCSREVGDTHSFQVVLMTAIQGYCWLQDRVHIQLTNWRGDHHHELGVGWASRYGLRGILPLDASCEGTVWICKCGGALCMRGSPSELKPMGSRGTRTGRTAPGISTRAGHSVLDRKI